MVVVRAVVSVTLTSLTALAVTSPAHAQTSDAPPAVVVEADIAGSGSWTSWVGLPSDRSLVITVDNRTNEPVADAALVMWFGPNPPGDTIEAPALPRLEPGQSTTLTVPLELGALAFGDHTARGTLNAAGTTVEFSATTNPAPWGLLLVPFLIAMRLAFAWRRYRAQRRSEHALLAEDTTTEPHAAAPSLAERVADELDAALDALSDQTLSDQTLTGEELLDAVERQAELATKRIAAAIDLEPASLPTIAANITQALLDRVDAPLPARR